MTELVSPANIENLSQDPRMIAGPLAPGAGWGSHPQLTSSDVIARRNKDRIAADARDAARTNPYGRSALRSTGDAIIGAYFKLQLDPVAKILGVGEDEAAEWAEEAEWQWELDANSSYYPLDAQRKQTFTDLMRTAWNAYYRDGETLGAIKWKASISGTNTCLLLLDAERLSDPMGVQDVTGNRRMGIERDVDGAPTAFHIRDAHPSDAFAFKASAVNKWTREERYTDWGRPRILHAYEHDRPDMTRGFSNYTSALLPMRLLQDYVLTELESAAVRATYAAVVESELDYEKAMQVIGETYAGGVNGNPILDFTLRLMADRAAYYRGQDFRFGKSKVAHLMPNEKLHMVQGNNHVPAVKDYNDVNLYTLASALGVDHATLTKNYSDTNYSGARAALFDVWRSYEVRRSTFISQVPMPFVYAWLEEKIVWTKKLRMLGEKSFFEVREALCRGTFETWNKPRLDPLKENQADKVLYDMGAMSLKELCAVDGRDYRRVLKQRAREKAEMKEFGLKPEDINPELLMNAGKDKNKVASDSSSADDGSAGGSHG